MSDYDFESDPDDELPPDCNVEVFADVTDHCHWFYPESVFCINKEYGVYKQGERMMLLKAKKPFAGADFGTFLKYDEHAWWFEKELMGMFPYQSIYDYYNSVRFSLTNGKNEEAVNVGENPDTNSPRHCCVLD